MKYNVGDKVRIKAWNEMEREFGLDRAGDIKTTPFFVADMDEYAGEILTIEKVEENYYSMKEDDGDWDWTDDMISYKVVETS